MVVAGGGGVHPAGEAHVTVIVAPLIGSVVIALVTVPNRFEFAAATYGPTTGPPPGAPAGTTGAVDASASARARFSRPLPV